MRNNIEMLSFQELILEINRLVAIKKTRALSVEEEEMRSLLRTRYIELYKRNLEHQLQSIKVVNENGEDITPKKIKDLKKQGDTNEK
ncbi:DUF896 family protein [Mesoplasma syrphidae]|uniref:DUF896 family protein n=1 Tax=Mesoplasma syrphidae TaxID=225999 RepID=A0A2K9CD36_9MOLU|nr:DUF896 domain-containing protein [Mesoplasma syrphidae]AUF83574.1 DUF896 family protein [Mesoplasma syrphidae]